MAGDRPSGSAVGPWPPGPQGQAWEENQTSSTPLGTDFPESSGDRERGRFRPAALPRLTTVAVVNDDGSPIGHALLPDLENTALQLKAIRRGLELLLELLAPADQIGGIDLIAEVSEVNQ